MEIREVNSLKLERIFLDMPTDLYKGDQNWIRPLDSDIQFLFNRQKNKLFRKGDACRWLLFNKSKCIGRVAAFYKNPPNEKSKIGQMGFFECIEDWDAAKLLFEQCKSYLKDKGFEGMEGPVNFGERDRWWGLMVDGFEPPVYGMLYVKKYYRKYFEDFGFKTYFEQYYFHYPISKPVPEKFNEKARRISANPNYSAKHLELDKIGYYTEAFRKVYNDSWAKFPGMKEMTQKQAQGIMKSLKPIMDHRVMWFAFYENNPIAFFIMIPDYNPIFAKFNGKLNLINKLRFLYYKQTKTIRKVYGIIFGVHPEHQGKGVEGYIIRNAADVVQNLGTYKDLEMTWIGDFNPKMLKIAEGLGASRCRTFITYRNLFNPNAKFERMPMLD